jgi:predicted nuclease of predicted toxin-antitoxin system
MAGLGVALYTDEMISTDLAPSLRRRGYDALSCEEAGRSRRKISDPEQLAYAAQQARAILTFNARDFVPLDRVFKATGQRHAGIILAPQIDDLGELIRCVARHLDVTPPVVQENTLLWLDTSPTT